MEIIASFTLVQEDAGRPLIDHEIWSQYTSFMTKDDHHCLEWYNHTMKSLVKATPTCGPSPSP